MVRGTIAGINVRVGHPALGWHKERMVVLSGFSEGLTPVEARKMASLLCAAADEADELNQQDRERAQDLEQAR